MPETIANLAELMAYVGLAPRDRLGAPLSEEALLRDLRAHIAIIKAPIEGYLEALRQGDGSDRITGVYIGASIDAAAPRPVTPRDLFFPFPASAWENAWSDIDFERADLMLRVHENA